MKTWLKKDWLKNLRNNCLPFWALFLLILLNACSSPAFKPSEQHLKAPAIPVSGQIPQPVQQATFLPKPKPTVKAETYSVVVNNVPVHELLFALARDAKLNVDVHPGITGTITLNAIDQTLPQLLTRISKQVDMRYEMEGPNLVVMPDTPFLRTYKIDYVNMSRDASSTVAIVTQIAATGSGATSSAATPSAAIGNNNSTTKVTNTAENNFWKTLVQNVKDILHETDKILPEGSSETVVRQSSSQSTTGTGATTTVSRSSRSSAQPNLAASPNPAVLENSGATVISRSTFREAASVIANPEAGILTIRATSRQHEKIQEFLDQVMERAKRQVLIEATVVEVRLSRNYQQGINWSRLRTTATGFTLRQTPTGTLPSAVSQGLFILDYASPHGPLGNVAATIQLLEDFGTVKVLSSPRISVLNNQTALLKVVDNRIYFTIKGDVAAGQNGQAQKAFTTTANSVPIGFVMTVTPQVSDSESVLLNIRPTISRIVGFVNDPNPDLATVNPPIISRIPEIQTREMESILKINSGQIAVMGGLMQDSIEYTDDAVPGLSEIPVVGGIFSHKNDTATKTELVIFLRPLVIKDASIEGDFSAYRTSMPDEKFLRAPHGPKPLFNPGGTP